MKNPKYLMPLAMLPLLCLLNYAALGFKLPVEVSLLEMSDSYNGTLPQPKSEGITDKFTAIKSVFGGGNTITSSWDEEEKTSENDTRYTEEQQKYLDSLTVAAIANDVPLGSPSDIQKEPLDKVFRREVKRKPRAKKKKVREPSLYDTLKTRLQVRKGSLVDYAAFTTIEPSHENLTIQAILDPESEKKSTDGSRVRIKVLEEFYIGENKIGKGSYLYAFIDGFKPHRVSLKISNILLGRTIIPVDLDIHDLDGNPGIYVPGSAFREAQKNGASQSAQSTDLSVESPEEASAMKQIFGDLFNSSAQAGTQSVAKAIRQNKVKFKYNTMVLLVPNNE